MCTKRYLNAKDMQKFLARSLEESTSHRQLPGDDNPPSSHHGIQRIFVPILCLKEEELFNAHCLLSLDLESLWSLHISRVFLPENIMLQSNCAKDPFRKS